MRHLHDYFIPHPRNEHRPHIFSTVSVATLVTLIIVFEAGYLIQTKFIFLKTDFLASVLPSVLVSLTNHDRTTQGLSTVTEDPLLNTAAQAAAEDMAAKGYFSHVSPDGKTPWYWLNQAGYQYSYAGQNLAVNFTDSQNVEAAWMASPTHRANIVKPQYTRVGFGTANGVYEGQDTTFVVEFFAAPGGRQAPRLRQSSQLQMTIATSSPRAIAIAATTSTVSTTSAIQVLGSETSIPPSSVVVSKVKSGLFASLLASPLTTFLTTLTALLILTAISFTTAVLKRGHIQNPSIILGGVSLLFVIAGAMVTSIWFAGTVQVPKDTQTASVYNALNESLK